MKGLIIKSPWIDKIFDGEKTWEIRGCNTTIRGRIALIKSGTGLILGTAELVDSRRLTEKEYQENQTKHQVPLDGSMPYPKTHTWVLTNPKRLDKPIPYTHPQGAVIWVNLPNVIQ